MQGGLAYVGGWGGAACSFDVTSNCDWLIRVYDQNTGALVWDKEFDKFKQDDSSNVILACGDRVLGAGTAGTNSNAPFGDWWVQSLDSSGGSLVWEDLLPTPATYAIPQGLAVAGDRVFVTGSTSDQAGGTQDGDYIVRAYKFGSAGKCGTLANNSQFF
jgi:hypothetical protein